MKRIVLITSLFILSININAQGLHFSTDEELKDVDVWINDSQGISEDIPSTFSLEKYCPPPLSQGADGTCVGYSVCYAAMSIMNNYQMGITDPFLKYALAFDPYFMYSALRMNMDVDCQEGLNMGTAMNFLYEKGLKRWAMMPYLDCRYEWSSDEWKFVQHYAQPFSIVNYNKIENMQDVKVLVGNSYPVMIGISMGKSIYSSTDMGGTVGANGLWTPKENEDFLGGHALTIIGYDDSKFGGAFRVMNSWGDKYGDNGFIWIKYSDYMSVVKEAWVIIPKSLGHKDENSINTDYFGLYDFENGNSYEGMISNDDFNGVGYYLWKDGDVYFGLWENGKRNGPGIFFDKKKQEYQNVNYENDIYIEDEGQGFSGDSRTKKLDTYLEKFKINLKKGKAGHDFEMPEIGSRRMH